MCASEINYFLLTCSPRTMVLLVIGLMVSATQAAMIQVGASKDNTLYESITGSLSNGVGDYLFAGLTDEDTPMRRRALLAFNVASAIPAGSTINSAILALQMSRTKAATVNVSLHAMQADWGEGTSDADGEEGGKRILGHLRRHSLRELRTPLNLLPSQWL
jgi:hypothetical protein